jgi:ADP-dependent NAD(P)H-hydrate dehydratase / NAD(P)H-hydrate epimerase
MNSRHPQKPISSTITRVLAVEELRKLDADANVSVDVLVTRAGTAVAGAAKTMLGGTYGRRVVVLAGPGKNGADGRIAAAQLQQAGAKVTVIDINRNTPVPESVPECDLLIDAAYGTGFHGSFRAPHVGTTPVLAVDIPSGVDATTGWISPDSQVLRATKTVTFAAWKPGLLLGEGAAFCGDVEVVDIGLGLPSAGIDAEPGMYVLQEDQVRQRLSSVTNRSSGRHKWTSAVGVVGGSEYMHGAPNLVALGALRSGSGMVRVGTPGGNGPLPIEVVGFPVSVNHWTAAALEGTSKCHAVVLGPGLGRTRAVLSSIRSFSFRVPQPLVLDADAFAAFGEDVDEDRSAAEIQREPQTGAGLRAVQEALARRQGRAPVPTNISKQSNTGASLLSTRRAGSTVLTPHDGEYEILVGRRPGPDRIEAARHLATLSGCVVLLKGSTTVVADASGRVEIVSIGDDRLATAGTGDVLSGIIGSFLAQGLGAFDAAACGAFVHGLAASRGSRIGLIATDLPTLVSELLSSWSE